jgi:hypothetical protein
MLGRLSCYLGRRRLVSFPVYSSKDAVIAAWGSDPRRADPLQRYDIAHLLMTPTQQHLYAFIPHELTAAIIAAKGEIDLQVLQVLDVI